MMKMHSPGGGFVRLHGAVSFDEPVELEDCELAQDHHLQVLTLGGCTGGVVFILRRQHIYSHVITFFTTLPLLFKQLARKMCKIDVELTNPPARRVHYFKLIHFYI